MTYSRRQLEYFGEPLGESITRAKPGGRIYGGGGGGSSTPSNQTVTQTSIPDYAKPYVERMLGRAEAVSTTPYQAYGGERIAGFSPLQQQAFQGVQNFQPSQQLGTATQMAGLAGLNAANINYQGGDFGNQYQRPTGFQSGEFDSQYQRPTGFQASEFGNQYQGPAGFQAGAFDNQYRGPQDFQAGTFGTAGVNAPSLQQFQMGGPERAYTRSFTQPGTVDAYMSPYQQAVTDIEKREATRASDITGQQQQAQAVQQGAFGGSRSAIVEAERQRNLGQQLGDIQARGGQAAYQQASQQFNAEQQARLQAQLANQQAGLTVGSQNLNALLGIQQLGAGQSLQSQLANQQMLMESQRLGEQSRQYGYGQGMTRSQLEAQYGTEAQRLAEQSRQFGYGQDMTRSQLEAQYGTEAQRLGEQSRQFGYGQDMTAAQLGAQYSTEAQRLGEQSRQFGYGQDMTAAQLGAQYGVEGQRMAEQSRQYGAGLGLQGLQTAGQMANTLGNLGQAQFGQQRDIIQGQMSAGTQQQALEQQRLSQQYQDFLTQRGYPQQQLSYMSDMLRGLPLSQSTQQMYQAPPSTAAQLAGLGTTLYGASRAFAGGGLAGIAANQLMQG